MLVLSRKVGEKIVLPALDVSITVLGVHGKRVRIGVSAPPGLTVHREEVLQLAFVPESAVPELVAGGKLVV